MQISKMDFNTVILGQGCEIVDNNDNARTFHNLHRTGVDMLKWFCIEHT